MSHRFVIPGAFFVPNIGLNTLSLSQLIQQGFVVTVKDSKCIIKNMFDTTSSEETEKEGSEKGGVTDSKIEDEEEDRNTSFEEQERLDHDKEKAIQAIIRYFDLLYFKDTIIEGKEKNDQTPSRNDFESLIGFLHMIHEQEIIEECKGLVAEHFEKLVKWFYKDFMHCEERPMPAKIGSTKICLLDLYLTVKGMGGHARVTIKNKWIDIAYAMGFPKEYADGLKECYATHLSLLGAYYEVARNYSGEDVVPRAVDCMGTSGIEARELPVEEATPNYIGTQARQMELDTEDGLPGKLEYDDGETLIISFEEDTEASDGERDTDQSISDEDNVIAID